MIRTIPAAMIALMIVGTLGCKSEIDGKPAAEVTEPAATTVAKEAEPAAAAKATTEVPIDTSASKVEWVGAKVTGDHKGGFNEFDGTATLNEAGELVALNVKVDATTVFSDAEKLTKHLRSPDFFDTEKYPTASFVTTEVSPATEGGTHTIKGLMDLRGVKKEISFPATIKKEGETLVADAEFTLMRFDFGINYKGKADDLIKDEVLMKLHIVVPTKPATAG